MLVASLIVAVTGPSLAQQWQARYDAVYHAFRSNQPKAFAAFFSRDYVYVGPSERAISRNDFLRFNQRTMATLKDAKGKILLVKVSLDGFEAKADFVWDYQFSLAHETHLHGRELGTDTWRFGSDGWHVRHSHDSRNDVGGQRGNLAGPTRAQY